MKQKYSILMSVYAKEKPDFLRESMQSMYNQTVPTDDFVLICDGPLNEGLDAVIEEMQEKFGKRLRVFRFPENRGLGLALRFGVEKCKNELIARMDSDDISVRDRAEKQLEIFEKIDVDVVGSNITEYDEAMENVSGIRKVLKNNEDIIKFAKYRNPMNHVSVFFKKDSVLKAGNYKDMPGFEDYYLWVRMIHNGSTFYNIQDSLVKVRGGMDMARRRGGRKYVKFLISFEKELLKLKFISKLEFIKNVSMRTVVSSLPASARTTIYKRALRGSE